MPVSYEQQIQKAGELVKLYQQVAHTYIPASAVNALKEGFVLKVEGLEAEESFQYAKEERLIDHRRLVPMKQAILELSAFEDRLVSACVKNPLALELGRLAVWVTVLYTVIELLKDFATVLWDAIKVIYALRDKVTWKAIVAALSFLGDKGEELLKTFEEWGVEVFYFFVDAVFALGYAAADYAKYGDLEGLKDFGKKLLSLIGAAGKKMLPATSFAVTLIGIVLAGLWALTDGESRVRIARNMGRVLDAALAVASRRKLPQKNQGVSRFLRRKAKRV